MNNNATKIFFLTLFVIFLNACEPPPFDTPQKPPIIENRTALTDTPVSDSNVLYHGPNVVIQKGNDLEKTYIEGKTYKDLAQNQIGDTFPLDRHSPPCPCANEDWSFTHVGNLSLKWVRVSLDPIELDQARSWDHFSEFEINPCQDQIITLLAENDITILNNIVYWDKTLHATNYPDYKDQDEIQLYLDYAQMIVNHFKGRINYYEILNEAVVFVDAEDYINLIHRVVPVIRAEDPNAKIVIGGSSNLVYEENLDFLFRILNSDVMTMVDGIALHPLYGASPDYDDARDYYYYYPELVNQIKETSQANGFNGEYFAEEMVWRTISNPNPWEPWQFTPIAAAKYYARGILINRGLDLWAGLGGEYYDEIQPIPKTVKNISNVLVEASPEKILVEIHSDELNIVSYTFVQNNGDHLMALWVNGIAVENDPGITAELIVHGYAGYSAISIDILNGFEQRLITKDMDGNMVIENLLVRDYPLLIRFTQRLSP